MRRGHGGSEKRSSQFCRGEREISHLPVRRPIANRSREKGWSKREHKRETEQRVRLLAFAFNPCPDTTSLCCY